MTKHMAALAAAVLMTVCAGAAVFAIGGAALFHQSGVMAASSPAQSSKATDASMVQQSQADQAQVQQLQAQISQYQAREQQYQAREQQYQQELGQAQAAAQQAQGQAQQQLQEMQQLLFVLQQRGLITINGDGSITINR
jgi:Mg-chelatase subunit ChlI